MKLMNLVSKAFSPSSVASIDSALKDFVEQSKHVNSAVISTREGIIVGSYAPEKTSLKKLSAMCSSIYTQAVSVSHEISDDPCNILTIESDSKKIIFYSIQNSKPAVFLTLIADKEKLLGELLFSAKSCSSIIEDLLKS